MIINRSFAFFFILLLEKKIVGHRQPAKLLS
jgi:hypothetical protein